MSMYGQVRLTVDCSEGGPSLTKQSFAADTDINNIIARFEKTGMIEHVNKVAPFYGDVSGLVSYQESLNVVKQANDLFNAMDARVRAKFDNDPAKLILFLSDEANLKEAVELGLCVERPVEQPAGDGQVEQPAGGQ